MRYKDQRQHTRKEKLAQRREARRLRLEARKNPTEWRTHAS